MSFHSSIVHILTNVHQCFQPNELAYLAVTSKVENPLRDQIAFALHARFNDQYLVHREWKDPNNKKADIAITDTDNKVQCLIECKAHSAPTYEKGYSQLALRDLQKMYNSSDESTELYFLFFLNHVHSAQPILDRFQYAIKYWKLLNNALQKFDFTADMTEHIAGHWSQHMKDIGLNAQKSRSFRIKGGAYYNMKVYVHAHLYGPVKRVDLKRIIKSVK
jgi:hypothetical protein